MKTESNQSLLHSAKWTVASNIAQEVLTGGLTFVLAAFLKPSEFGVVAMAYIYVTFLELILGSGFNIAILQRRDVTKAHLDSVFWLNQAVGLVLAAGAILASGWWSRVNQMPELQPMILVLTVLIPIQALSLVQSAMLQKKMDFKAIAIRNNSATLAGGIVGICLVLAGYGAWALVWQYIAKGAASVVLLWRLNDWRPGLEIKKSCLGDLSGFAGKTFVGQIGVFVQQQADSIVIGVILGPAALGLYKLADRLVEINLKFLPRALQFVALPHFSKLQDNLPELNRAALLALHLNSLVTFPSMAFLAGAAPVLLGAVGSQWKGGEWVLVALSVAGASKGALIVLGPLLQALGRPGLHSFNTWMLAVCNVAVAYGISIMAVDFASNGRVAAVAAGRAGVFLLVFSPLALWQARQVSGLSLRRFWAVIRPALLISVLILGTQWIASPLIMNSAGRFVSLGISAVLGFTVFLIGVRMFDSSGWAYILKGFELIRHQMGGSSGGTRPIGVPRQH